MRMKCQVYTKKGQEKNIITNNIVDFNIANNIVDLIIYLAWKANTLPVEKPLINIPRCRQNHTVETKTTMNQVRGYKGLSTVRLQWWVSVIN